MSSLLERIKWIIFQYREIPIDLLVDAIVNEIESTHKIIDPENITEEMVEASFHALPAHYDPPDPTRRQWHALKARRRFTAMAKAAGKIKC